MQSTFFQTSFTFADNFFLQKFTNIYSYVTRKDAYKNEHFNFTTNFYEYVSNIRVFKAMIKHLKTPSEAGRFQSMGARNRVGIGLSYRPARLHSLAELVPWNRFLGSFKV